MPLLQKAYLGATPLFKESAFFENDVYSSIDSGSNVTVTADTAAHTKGGWSELIASTSANASLLEIRVTGISASGVNTATLLDIGFGASGSEVVKIENVAVGGAAGIWMQIPFQVPSGTRIAARIQSVITGGKTASVLVRTYDMGDYAAAPTSVDVIGTNTATSAGVQFGNLSQGVYQEIVASTSQAYRGMVVVGSISGTATANLTVSYTVSRGASGSEIVLRDRVDSNASAAESMNTTAPSNTLFGASIPSGSRLSVKPDTAGNITTSYASCLIGIP